MKSTALILVLVFAAARPHQSEEYMYTTFNELSYDEVRSEKRIDYLEISSLPKKDIYFPLEPIEAECKVFGMPVPVVEWVHNSRVIHNNDFEISTSMNHCSGVATVVARLIIKPHHVKPGTIKTFTCVGRSGSRTVKASTNVHFSHESTQIYLISNGILSALVGGETTKIYEFYENLFDTIGSTVLLPCKATNKANIHWIDEVGKEITGQDPRFEILPTGELVITHLQFKDMGTYICLAKNSVSRDVVSTFLYPLAEKM